MKIFLNFFLSDPFYFLLILLHGLGIILTCGEELVTVVIYIFFLILWKCSKCLQLHVLKSEVFKVNILYQVKKISISFY